MKHLPYYIFTPDYDRKSAGNRVMHLLCHYLNTLGEKAHVVCNETNKNLNTPIVHRINEDGIVVYPEIYKGNPLNATKIVRYILSDRYKEEELQPRGMLWYYSKIYTKDEDRVLYLPSIDTKIFNMDGVGERIKEYKSIGRSKGVPETMGKDAIEITQDFPSTPEELANKFKHAKVFYCYHSSALATEAILCGCPVVIVRNEKYDFDFSRLDVGMNGIAMNDDEESLEKARTTIPLAIVKYHQIQKDFLTKLRDFIDKTQKEFV